ncbi:MAG: excinuclease ABC subunit UvrA, partial [Bdellovibrionales bacterium]|nr:excinuclease ABC subunit UvrA [Bdellovibrionales bacterium]
ESLSSYSRNFLEQMKKPQVEAIVGLSPSIAIDQKSISPNPRSTVGTITEVYDYLRLLYARVGVPLCPEHGVPVSSQSPQQIVKEIMSFPPGTKFSILAPVAQGKKGEFLAEFQKWEKKGFSRARVDGQWVELSKAKKLAKRQAHDIEILVDRLSVEDKYVSRMKESLQLALGLSKGLVLIEPHDASLGGTHLYSIHRACPICAYSFPPLEPRLFSFNNPKGACLNCSGLGFLSETGDSSREFLIGGESKKPCEDDLDNSEIENIVCPSCKGMRLKPEVLNVHIAGKNIAELSQLPINSLKQFFLKDLCWEKREKLIADKLLQQILFRIEYLERVGTGYLSLSRKSGTLSGGEAQRIRLASQVGSALVGVLYVLDEPSIGLHPRDHRRLLDILQEMRERGNTVLLVEHDEETIRAAQYLIDLGPKAGRLGGEVMAQGTPDEVMDSPLSLTGRYLSGVEKIPYPRRRREGSGYQLILDGATGNNLKSVQVKLPLGCLIGVTGVSGSGKSTLVIDTLYRAIDQHFYQSPIEPAAYKKLVGLEYLDKVIDINQKPIGRTPRSTPATYVGVLPLIREVFSGLPEAKMRGFKPGHFSFNIKGGRCEVCAGGGQVKVEMHFLSDVYVRCDACMGSRYTRETLSLEFKNKSIADVLEMTVDEASDFFKHHLLISKKLETLKRVGLDYMNLGQSSVTLSGGEAQRIKLSKELSKRGTGKTLYILDEPTTGLHFEDIRKLIELLHELVDQGN